LGAGLVVRASYRRGHAAFTESLAVHIIAFLPLSVSSGYWTSAVGSARQSNQTRGNLLLKILQRSAFFIG
jgi:hypothetical protein